MNNEEGFSLVEVLVSIVILALIGTAILFGLSTASKTVLVTDQLETAKNLAETQMEYIKTQPYAFFYNPAPIPSEYVGYSAQINVSNIVSRDNNIQKITVIVEQNTKQIITLEGYKVN